MENCERMKVLTFSRAFPSYHPRKGEPTGFIPKVWTSLLFDCKMHFDLDMPELESEIKNYYTSPMEYKHHTIRAGHRFKAGEFFSPRVWSGKPYASKQIKFAPPIQIKKTWNFEIDENGIASLDGKYLLDYEDGKPGDVESEIAYNDGLNDIDFFHWLIYPVYKSAKPFDGQIICWNENIEY